MIVIIIVILINMEKYSSTSDEERNKMVNYLNRVIDDNQLSRKVEKSIYNYVISLSKERKSWTMPPARVQTGQTNRPSSARVESARNNSARQLSARPASARVRQLSSRSINPSARRGKLRPNDISGSPKMGNQNASVRAMQVNSTVESGDSARRQGTAWTVPSSEELRGR